MFWVPSCVGRCSVQGQYDLRRSMKELEGGRKAVGFDWRFKAEQRLGERLRRLGAVRQQKLQLATSSVAGSLSHRSHILPPCHRIQLD